MKSEIKLGILYNWAQPCPVGELKRRNTTGTALLYDSIHMVRDGRAALLTITTLFLNFVFSGVEMLLNLPEAAFKLHGFGAMPEFTPNDLILLSTRLALGDHLDKDQKKKLISTGSPIETAIFNACRPYFRYCDRKTITLGQVVENMLKNSGKPLPPELKIDFPVNNGVKNINATRYGYLLFLPEIPALGGAKFLTLFSAKGTDTLVFTQLLNSTMPEVIVESIAAGKPRIMVFAFNPVFEHEMIPLQLKSAFSARLNVQIDVSF